MFVEEHIPALQTNSRRLRLQHLFSLLQTCKSTKTLTQIHAQLIAHGAAQKSFLLVNLLSLYVSSGHLEMATRVFNRIRNPSTGVWNQMIRGHGATSEPRKSVGMFREMEKIGALSDGYTFCYVIEGCANGELFSEGRMMHGKVLKRWFCSDVFVRTNLVNFYCSCGSEEGALKVFDEMHDRNVVAWNSLLSGFVRCGRVEVARRVFDEMPERNMISWTSMIDGCSRNGRCREALSLFRQMYEEGVGFDQVSLVVALSACSELGDLDTGRWIHQLGIKKLSRDKTAQELVSFNNTLIHMYASCGAINEAYRVFRDMTWKTTVSWTSVITGFAKQGLGNEALRLFEEMELLKDVMPDEVTFLGVMSACSHTGRVDEGWRYFHDMKHKWGIEPKIEHYGCMVDVLSRAGMLEEAFEFVEAMPIKPNDLIWGTLLNGCRIHRNVELSSHLFSRKIVPEKAAGYVMLLSELYSSSKRWLDAHSVKKRIDETGMRKPSGRSWVQIDGAPKFVNVNQ